jgi:hypothetical protein
MRQFTGWGCREEDTSYDARFAAGFLRRTAPLRTSLNRMNVDIFLAGSGATGAVSGA